MEATGNLTGATPPAVSAPPVYALLSAKGKRHDQKLADNASAV
jgi:hypothetical protein